MPAIEHGRWWTADEARQLQQEDRGWPRYEVIDGELLVTPGASWHHQSVSGAFYRRIWAYVNEHRLAVEVLYSPADVQLKPGTLVQPDVFAFPKGKRRAGKWSDVTSLLLAIEIISPGSVRYDRVTKKRFFQEMSVPEYWIVDSRAHAVERWAATSEMHQVLMDVVEWQPFPAIPPLRIDLPELFNEVIPFDANE